MNRPTLLQRQHPALATGLTTEPSLEVRRLFIWQALMTVECAMPIPSDWTRTHLLEELGTLLFCEGHGELEQVVEVHDEFVRPVQRARRHISDSTESRKKAGHLSQAISGGPSFVDANILHHSSQNPPRNILHHNSAHSLPAVPHQPLNLTGAQYLPVHRGWTDGPLLPPPTAPSELQTVPHIRKEYEYNSSSPISPHSPVTDLSVEWGRVQRGALQAGQTAHSPKALHSDLDPSTITWA